MIHGERVKRMREMHRMTQAELADCVHGLTQSRLSRIEKGFAEPDLETSHLLAMALGVTIEYFHNPAPPDLMAHSPQLRSRTRLTEKSKSAAIRWAQFVDDEFERLYKGGTPLDMRIQSYFDRSPAEAATEVRSVLGFTRDEPLQSLILAIERVGVRVLGLPYREDALDAFCAWRDGEPLIALLTGVPGDRIRFSAAHELGHLVLHRPGTFGPNVEAEADQFASELLTPSHAIVQHLPTRPTLSSLAMLKTHWGVSVKSLVRRARELNVIDKDRAASLYRQISARGWNRAEPGHVPREKPRAFRKLVEINYGSSPSSEQVARGAGWSEELALSVLAEHASAAELPFRRRESPESVLSSNVIQLRPIPSMDVRSEHA